jgi:hypothetical protein
MQSAETDRMHKRYASYHWHILSTLAQRHCAAPTFQAQCALVQAFDSALDLLESEPSFQQLTVAGGCAVLEDYLRLRPEHFERLETAVQRGALHINPFYALPEPSLHTPEGLVRNLLRGTACADVFGGAMPVALFLEAEMLPAWLPQVLRGFKLSAVLAHTPSAQPLEQLWQGDDGTRVPLAYVYSLSDHNALDAARDALAPRCQSGHFLVPCRWTPLSAESWRAWLSDFARRHKMDIVLHSAPEAYARAAQLSNTAEVAHGALMFAEQPRRELAEVIAQLEQFIATAFEPLIVLAALQDQPVLPSQPQRLIEQLWQPLFACESAAPEDLEHHAQAVRRQAAQFAQDIGVCLETFSIDRIVRTDCALFAISACKLPADPSRSGIVVRGRLNAAQSAWLTLQPMQPFACCEVVSLAEVPSGGSLAAEPDGTFRFRAEPQHFYTFWLHN